MDFVFNVAGKDTAVAYTGSDFYFMLCDLRDYYDAWSVADTCAMIFEGTDASPARLIIDYELTPATTNDNAQYLFRNGQPVYYHKNGQPLKRRPE